tara:strand:+ start:554 stop:859 length:306 start_codon:yes stop_codon:yes gene_type:complete
MPLEISNCGTTTEKIHLANAGALKLEVSGDGLPTKTYLVLGRPPNTSIFSAKGKPVHVDKGRFKAIVNFVRDHRQEWDKKLRDGLNPKTMKYPWQNRADLA